MNPSLLTLSVADTVTWPKWMRLRPLENYSHDELVIGARLLRERLKEVEDEIARRP